VGRTTSQNAAGPGTTTFTYNADTGGYWSAGPTSRDSLAALGFQIVRVVLLDLGVGGTELLRPVKVKRPDIDVIMMTGQGEEGLPDGPSPRRVRRSFCPRPGSVDPGELVRACID